MRVLGAAGVTLALLTFALPLAAASNQPVPEPPAPVPDLPDQGDILVLLEAAKGELEGTADDAEAEAQGTAERAGSEAAAAAELASTQAKELKDRITEAQQDAQQTAQQTEQEVQEAFANPASMGDVDTASDNAYVAQPEEGAAAEGLELAARVGAAIKDEVNVASTVASAGAGISLIAFSLVTRYISPKEALKNPQRAMLYGFVRAQPGCHLKQVADEFQMKTSSILWHMRKLEAAELVHSDRANGFRVFYPVEGGIEIKRISRGLTALQNDNAHAVFGLLASNNGLTTRQISERLNIHMGTVRWHLRKMREFGLVDELLSEDASRFFSTRLGDKALEALEGRPAVEAPRGSSRPVSAEA